MSTETDIKLQNNCTPRNALFCCHTPICLTTSPKLLPIDYELSRQLNSVPVRIPDLSKLGTIDVTNGVSNHSQQQQQQQSKTSAPSTPVTPVDNQSPPQPKTPKKALSPEVRHGVVLRRVSPLRKTIGLKKPDPPMMGVVLRKVDKNTLAPPKPRPSERSPPPKKALAKSAPKSATSSSATKTITATANKPAIQVTPAPPKPPPPVNLLKNRPPLEIHRIEGDKIIIIRKIPRARPPGEHGKPHNRHNHHHHHSGKHVTATTTISTSAMNTSAQVTRVKFFLIIVRDPVYVSVCTRIFKLYMFLNSYAAA